MAAWSDIGKDGVMAVVKGETGANPRPVSYFEFNRQMSCCLIHWRCCYVHRVLGDTVNMTKMLLYVRRKIDKSLRYNCSLIHHQ